MPPSWARAIAIADSVTVSMLADTIGTARSMPRVKLVRRVDVAPGRDRGAARNDQDVVVGEAERDVVGVSGVHGERPA